MAEEIEWWDFAAQDDLVDQLVGDISFIIESALDARGQALIAFPGGSTPQPIFAKLAQSNIRWKNVTIIPTDDRLVAVDNPLSNVARGHSCRWVRVYCRLTAKQKIISWLEAPQMRGYRICIGRLISFGWVSARMAIRLRSLPGLISTRQSMATRNCELSELRLTRCLPKRRLTALR